MSSLTIETVNTTPFEGQKPGTSGLRKKVKEFEKPNYLENFVQSIFDSLPSNELQNAMLVVSGDGRYYNDHAIEVIIRMSAAAGIGHIILGQNNLMSTPCVSGVIRERKAYGGIILTASHNPGGPTQDFGIKYNCQNGGPAPENLTEKMYQKTKEIKRYKIAKEKPQIDYTKVGNYPYGNMTIEVIDAPAFYSKLMQKIFDFDLLRRFLARPDFSMIYDSMHGVAGPFARQVFVKDLGGKESSLMNADPKPDFGGGHPDPNLTYAEDLVVKMGLPAASAHAHGNHEEEDGSSHGHGHSHGGGGHGDHSEHKGSSSDKIPDFGAASDGDADRNMILGAKFFVTPSDSVAIIAANSEFIPYFSHSTSGGPHGVKGVARSMPTSQALDRVALHLSIPIYEVPTGWKFFGNLMDANQLSICGEESFGTGSDHIREKDGMWAILAWLSIIAGKNERASKSSGSASGKLVSVKDIVEEHWKKFGRNYYSRYDYEQVDSAAADKVMSTLIDLTTSKPSSSPYGSYELKTADEFTYKDPVDHSVSEHQGIRFIFTDGSRIVFRLSGTGSVGATIRVYVERYEQQQLDLETAVAIQPLIDIALRISKMKELTGRDAPTVIT